MKQIKLITWLYEQYQVLNEKVPCINFGGCGAFAEKLFILLTSLGLKPQLVVITDNKKGMAERVKGGAFWYDKYGYASVTHIVVKVKGKIIDSTGIYDNVNECCVYHNYGVNQRKASHALTIDVLKKWNKNTDMWNSRFNRRHIKVIEKKLNECYKKYEKVLVVSN